MMATRTSLQLLQGLRPCEHHRDSTCFEASKIFQKYRAIENRLCMSSHSLLTSTLRPDARTLKLSHKVNLPLRAVPNGHNVVTCQLGQAKHAILLSIKTSAIALTRAYNTLQESPLIIQCAPAIGLMVFAAWGLGPLLQLIRHVVLRRNARNWEESNTHHFMTSYLRPILLWTGAILICRAFDPVVLPSETSQDVKQRLLNFVRSLSTVLAFAYCTSSVIQQAQKFVMEHNDTEGTNVGFQFVGKAIYTAVWVAAVALFMELLGFSTQKWITAGGLGTVLLTLAGREIFTNFLSSVMIHATRPFVVNEWIQTKIEGYEVSGTVEHVGWWSPTIVRGDDREAVHIPNHKFTVSVVRNLSQKTHWRIKTHLAISHLDANKIGNIVADMRKVLEKYSQVEQQRLHRRVFLENINPESQALLILVSCFVKTPHFEDYLRVKEAVLVDLLRVISSHKARLATPIRTVHKMYGDSTITFEETASERGMGVVRNRPFLLIESPTLNVEDKGKQRSLQNDQELNSVHRKVVASEARGTESEMASSNGSSKNESSDVKNNVQKERDFAAADSHSKSGKHTLEGVQILPPKLHLEGLDSMGLNSNDKTLLGAAFEKPVDIPEAPIEVGILKSDKEGSSNEKTSTKSLDKQSYQNASRGKKNGTNSSSEVHISMTEKNRGKSDKISRLESELRVDKGKQQGQGSSSPSSPKNESERSGNLPSTSRSSMEENLPLGVALNGPKRTLPIDGNVPSEVELKELAACRNSNGNSGAKGKRESQLPPSGVVQSD